MFTTAKNNATSATTTWIHPRKLTKVKTVNSPAMNNTYTSEVTARKTMPMMNTFLREPVCSVRASRIESTHSEQGLNPSTKAMRAVLTIRDCAARLTGPISGISSVAEDCTGGSFAGDEACGGVAVVIGAEDDATTTVGVSA